MNRKISGERAKEIYTIQLACLKKKNAIASSYSSPVMRFALCKEQQSSKKQDLFVVMVWLKLLWFLKDSRRSELGFQAG
jgi:hypothetical protein